MLHVRGQSCWMKISLFTIGYLCAILWGRMCFQNQNSKDYYNFFIYINFGNHNHTFQHPRFSWQILWATRPWTTVSGHWTSQFFTGNAVSGGHQDLDLMETLSNMKCKCFLSRAKFQEAKVVDALNSSWVCNLVYAFLPVPLIFRLLDRHLGVETAGIPLWLHSWKVKANWFGVFCFSQKLGLLVQIIHILESGKGLSPTHKHT